MRIIGIDPGDTTGVAIIDSCDGEGNATEFPGWLGAVQAIKVLMNAQHAPFILAIEAFDIGSETIRRGNYENALNVIGAVRWLASEYGVDIRMVPRGHKRVLTETRLERFGFVEKTPGGHANDAARVAIATAIRYYGLSLA